MYSLQQTYIKQEKVEKSLTVLLKVTQSTYNNIQCTYKNNPAAHGIYSYRLTE